MSVRSIRFNPCFNFSLILKLLFLQFLMSGMDLHAQTNPAPQQIPYSQDFGNNWFKLPGLPAGFAIWRVAGSPRTSLLTASNSTANANETSFDSATVIKSTGLGYGYSAIGSGGVPVNNGQVYFQTSSNSTSGTDQLALAISTTGYMNIKISYDVEMLNPQPKFAGLVLQYRVGNSGTWTVIDSSYEHSGNTRIQNQIDYFVNKAFGSDADNQAMLQIRWATSRSSNPAGGSSGIALDNIIIIGDPVSSSLHYRSVSSGLWNDPGIWESSPDSNAWSAATLVPSSGDLSITIRSPHTVSSAGMNNLVIDQVLIQQGATLWNAWNTAMAIGDGPSTVDLDVQGTFVDSSNISVVWANTARWRMGNSGTYIKTYSTNSTNWQLYYYNGISTIPSTSTWICRKAAGSNVEPSISTTNGGPPYPQVYYGNLIIENNTATWNSNALCRFQGSLNYPIIKGDFTIGGSGTGIVSFLYSNTNVNPLKVIGSLIVKAGSTIRNEGTGIEVQKDVDIDGTHSYGSSTSKLLFSGSLTQSVNGLGTINTWKTEINKSANAVNLNRTISIYGNLNLIAGKFFTSTASILHIMDNATATGASNASFVSGPLRKTGDEGFVFPIGKGNLYRLMAMSTGNGQFADQFTAEYFPIDPVPVYNNILEPSLDHISRCEYWFLNKDGGNSTRTVTLSWNINSCGVDNPADLVVARFTGVWWENKGNTGFTGNSISGTVTSQVNTLYGPFTLASTTALNPLPIELLSFAADFDGRVVKLNWLTYSEINNDYFLVERSSNGKDFVPIEKVNGSGTTSSMKEYSAIDLKPLDGIAYYRLKQIDFDGASSYSEIISIRVKRDVLEILSLNVEYSTHQLNLNISFPENGKAKIILRDPIGKLVKDETINNLRGLSSKEIYFQSEAHGIYTLQLIFNDESVIKRFYY